MKKTAKKDIEKELKTFYSAVEQTADAIFITDKEGVIKYANPAFSEMTGFSKKEALGKNPRIIKSGLQSKEHYEKLWTTILSGKTFRSTVVNRKKNGELFYADHTITPIKDEKENILYFIGIWKDITKQILLEQRKDEFISIASHELKTPITSVKSFVQIINKRIEKYSDKELYYFVSKIDNQLNRLTLLINEFLDVSKIHAGKLKLDLQKFNFNEFINEIVLDYKYRISSHQIIKEGNVDQLIFADRYRLEQVFINLINNAIKYSPYADKIIIRTMTNKDEIKISIQDFGIGIDKNYHDKIFERFYQIDELATKKSSGLGIGLYISSEIIKRHGGELWVDSNKGKGSSFHFTLPIK